MSKNSEGSLGYQMMKALQFIFQLGASRHNSKRHHRNAELIIGISTVRCMSADVNQLPFPVSCHGTPSLRVYG